VALLARDRGEVALAFQVLESPMLDDRQITRSSQIDGLPIWSRELNAFGWRSYLGSLYNTGDVRAAPQITPECPPNCTCTPGPATDTSSPATARSTVSTSATARNG
jgi:acetyl esterase/lipase